MDKDGLGLISNCATTKARVLNHLLIYRHGH